MRRSLHAHTRQRPLPRTGERGLIVGRVLGFVVLLLLIVAGAIAFVPSLRVRVSGVPLRLRFVEGRETRFKTTLDGKVKIEVSGLPDTALPKETAALLGSEIPFRVESRTRQMVKKVSDDGAEVETTSEGGSIEIQIPNEKPVSYPLPATPAYTLRMDAQGRLQMDSTNALSSGLKPTDMYKLQDFLGTLSSRYLPGDVKRMGATWSDDVDLSIKAQSTTLGVKGKVGSVLAGVTQRSGSSVADVASDQDLDVKVALARSGVNLTLEGDLTGKSDCFLDWSAGEIVGTEGATHLDLNLRLKTQQPQMVDVKAHVTGDFKTLTEKL